MQAPMAMPCSPPSELDRLRITLPIGMARPAAAPKKSGLFGKLRKALGGGGASQDAAHLSGPPAEKRKRESTRGADKSLAFRDSLADRDMSLESAAEIDWSVRSYDSGGGGDALVDLLALQQADGSFAKLDQHDDVLARSGVDVVALRGAVTAVLTGAGSVGSLGAVVQTLTALAAMRLAFADLQAVWKRAAKKAFVFVIGAASVHGKDIETWIEEIVRRIQAA